MKNNRADQMQFLRVLAFFNIYMLHAGHWNFFNYPGWFGAISAVNFFFMLSGFLTGYSFREEKAVLTLPVYRQYMKNKIARFYPLYFLVTVYAISFSAIPQTFATGHFGNLVGPVVQLFKHLLCIQSWFPDGFFSYYGPAWFSATLLALTALNLPFFLLLKAVSRSRSRNALLLVLTALFFGGTFIYCYLTRNTFLQFTHYIFPPSRAGIYLGSMTAGLLVRPVVDRMRAVEGRAAIFTALEAGVLVFWFVTLFFPGREWMEWNAAWILPNILVLVVFIFGKGMLSRLFSLKPLVALGNVTMECYMVHSLVIPSYSRYNKFDTTYTLGCLFSLFACFALTFLVAFTLNRCSRSKA